MRSVWMMWVAALVLVVITALGARAEDAPLLKVDREMAVAGEGRWDYITVDPAGKLLYVPRTTHVMVLEARTGKTVADIPDTQGVHGVALVPAVGRGFTSNGKD